MARSETRPEARIEQLDGLRAVAFLAVFAHHAVHLPYGEQGVDVFFVLSGFLITRNLVALRDGGTTRSAFAVFFYRRVLRILPPYYLALAVMIALEPFPLHETPWYFGFASNIRDSLYPVLEGPMVTMWSVAVEEQFYLVWPLIVLLLPRRHLVTAFALTLVAAPIFRVLFTGNPDAVYRLTLSRMDLLAIGALLAWAELRDETWIRRRATRFVGAGVAAVAVFAACKLAIPGFVTGTSALYDGAGYALLAMAVTAVFVIVRVAARGPLQAILCLPPVRYVGKVSYMAYLIHVVGLDLAHRLPIPGPARILFALILTIGFATVSWYAFEQPLARLRHRVVLRT